MHQHLVGLFEGVQDGDLLVRHVQQLVVGNDDEGVDLVAQIADTGLGLGRTAVALEGERAGHDTNGQGPEGTSNLGDDGSSTCASPTALTGGDEDHVGALEGLLDLVSVILGSLTSLVRVRTCTQSSGEVPADVELDVGIAREEGLGIGVDSEELNSLESRLDHAVNGIAAATAYPHDLDHGEVVLGWNSHWSSASLLSDGPV